MSKMGKFEGCQEYVGTYRKLEAAMRVVGCTLAAASHVGRQRRSQREQAQSAWEGLGWMRCRQVPQGADSCPSQRWRACNARAPSTLSLARYCMHTHLGHLSSFQFM